jgi:hypothetical protein
MYSTDMLSDFGLQAKAKAKAKRTFTTAIKLDYDSLIDELGQIQDRLATRSLHT